MRLRSIYQDWADDHPEEMDAVRKEAQKLAEKIGAVSSHAKWRAMESVIATRMAASPQGRAIRAYLERSAGGRP